MNRPCSRRGFLAALAAAAAAPVRAQAPKSQVVDTHVHCFAGPKDERFPYHPQGPYQPEAAPPEQLLACMDGAGVDYAIIVHPEPYQDDHRYLEHCLQVCKGRVKGTCLFFADRPDSLAAMSALARRLPIVAVRIHAYAPDRLPPFGKPELRRFWKQAVDLGLAVQLHFEPRYAPGFEPLIQEFAAGNVIIDHLGRPFQGTPQEHQVVVGWSRFPRTIMKLSAIPSQRDYPHRDITPVVRRLTDAFGPERLIYGGGFAAGAAPASYRAARERVRSYLAHLPPAEQDKVLGGNAAKLFGFRGA